MARAISFIPPIRVVVTALRSASFALRPLGSSHIPAAGLEAEPEAGVSPSRTLRPLVLVAGDAMPQKPTSEELKQHRKDLEKRFAKQKGSADELSELEKRYYDLFNNISDIKALGDRTLWLENGRMAKLGDTTILRPMVRLTSEPFPVRWRLLDER